MADSTVPLETKLNCEAKNSCYWHFSKVLWQLVKFETEGNSYKIMAQQNTGPLLSKVLPAREWV